MYLAGNIPDVSSWKYSNGSGVYRSGVGTKPIWDQGDENEKNQGTAR